MFWKRWGEAPPICLKNVAGGSLFQKTHLSPAPDPRKEKKALVSDCQAFFAFWQKTCLGLDKQANQERMIFFERGGGVL